MARPPVATGEIPEGGAIELLREVETRSLTGVLEFEATDGDARGEIAFFGGEIAVDQTPREDGQDPVDVLLEIGVARYRLHQRLPPLPVSKGNDWQKSGSLAVHVPADLMNYCEHAGLTGVLELRHEDRRAEAIYRGGELLAIELDGEDAADLQEVFGWERGRFRIDLDASAPARLEPEPEEAPTQEWKPVPPKKREDTRQFLRVVEMALADVVHESERARSPTRTSPPLPPPPPARPRPPALPTPQARRKRDEQTVRLIYLSGDAPAPRLSDTSTRHVGGGVAAELAITDARPERRATPNEEPDAMAKKKKKTAPKKKSPPKKAAAASPEAEARADAEAEASASSSEAEIDSAAASVDEPSASEDKEPASEVGGAAGPSAPAAKKTERPVDPVMSGSVLNMVGWTFGMLGVALLVLMFLSVLPPVSCPPGSDNCGWGWGAGCVRTSNDAENCGACGNVCASGRCVFGECAEE